ncbi:MAG TPA: hypothetical protein VN456_13885 [Desulfosporosinus sp.]|nr:hypothetical protein [Desulfosporosinus sp.]
MPKEMSTKLADKHNRPKEYLVIGSRKVAGSWGERRTRLSNLVIGVSELTNEKFDVIVVIVKSLTTDENRLR